MLERTLHILNRRLSFYYRGVQFVPLPEKAETGGEDAYLSIGGIQAVLDGVSWWRNNAQVDAGLYSAAIARSMYEYVEEDLLGDIPASSYRLLEEAYNNCRHGNVVGTCTALVATLQERNEELQNKDGYKLINLDEGEEIASCESSELVDNDNIDKSGEARETANESDSIEKTGKENAENLIKDNIISTTSVPSTSKNNYLDVAQIGDCSLMIIRQGRVVFVSEEQSHDLDYPFQIGSGSKDTPANSIRFLIPVQRGDVIIMGTDGLFDNLYTHRIASIIWSALEKVFVENNFFEINSHTKPELISTNKLIGRSWKKLQENVIKGSTPSSSHRHILLTDGIMGALEKSMQQVIDEAVTISRDVRGDSPYASKCIENGALYEGGKPDDITLLVSVLDDVDEGSEGERFAQSEIRYPIPYRDWPETILHVF